MKNDFCVTWSVIKLIGLKMMTFTRQYPYREAIITFLVFEHKFSAKKMNRLWLWLRHKNNISRELIPSLTQIL